MTQLELQQYLLRKYPPEDTRCEWKEFKNMKSSYCGDEKDDVIANMSAIANMEGEHLVIGVHDNTCRHFCVYCYANTSKELVLKNKEKHKSLIPKV